MAAPAFVRVWDPLQRLLHWGLVGAIAIAWWAGEPRLAIHLGAGYAAWAFCSVRIIWGWTGSRYARFSSFVRKPAIVWRYARATASGQERRCIGHNPLGGAMVLMLLAVISLVCLSGWLYTTDRFWGLAWLEWLHVASAWTLVGLIALHLAGVAFVSWRHRENLVAAMFSGRKRASLDPEGATPAR